MAKKTDKKQAVKKPSAPAKSAKNSTNLVQRVTMGKRVAREFPKFRAGDTVSVYVRVREGEKERVQLYRGVVVKVQGSGMGRSFTVRKMSSGVGVERTFPYQSPAIDRVELVATGNVRRAKLLFLRELKGRAANIDAELAGQQSSETVTAAPEAAPEASSESNS
jgi:large subunit ribosomal protein L19